jgi:GDP-L-fucose synthase
MSSRHFSAPSKQRLDEYYNDKVVAVAGGAGFVGVQLVTLLADLVGPTGKVFVFDDFSQGGNIVSRDNVYYTFRTGRESYWPYEMYVGEEARRRVIWPGCDVSNTIFSCMLEEVEIFFNLTAVVAGVLHNQNHHLQMYDDNIRVLASPLRACKQAGVPAYFQTSSVCVYAEDHQSPCDEEEGWGGPPHEANAGYAEAKRDGERMALWSDIDRVIIGRPSNIIGPHDYYGSKAHVVPAFIERSVTTDGTFQAYGSGTVQREFIYSWDVAVGMLYAMAFGEDRKAYNIGAGGDNVITMLSLASKINQIVAHTMNTGKDPNRRIVFNQDFGGGDDKRYSNADRLRALGWKHTIDLNTALGMIVREFLFRGGWKDPSYWNFGGNNNV